MVSVIPEEQPIDGTWTGASASGFLGSKSTTALAPWDGALLPTIVESDPPSFPGLFGAASMLAKNAGDAACAAMNGGEARPAGMLADGCIG
ncbi:MAG: hypothetical protein JF606_25540 [Burkholderiales bacterium]|nr:hypothetical protein [Burkholderiales bacterium]